MNFQLQQQTYLKVMPTVSGKDAPTDLASCYVVAPAGYREVTNKTENYRLEEHHEERCAIIDAEQHNTTSSHICFPSCLATSSTKFEPG